MHEYTVEFRIVGKDLVPSNITRDLHLKPSLTRKTGQKLGSIEIRESLWAFNGYINDEAKIWDSLNDGLIYVLEKLLPVKTKIDAYKGKYNLVLWCGHFQSSFDGGPLLSPYALKLLGEFGVELFIDNYFSDESDCNGLEAKTNTN